MMHAPFCKRRKKMKPLILITNDDGVFSPGLKAAVEAVMDFADVIISAPLKQQTGMGRAFPRTETQGIIKKTILETEHGLITAYGVDGSPAYAAAHGVLELAPRKPDLCISGINYGENVGMVLSCSGTVGAMLEANTHGVPGLALSAAIDLSQQRTSDYPEYDWTAAKEVTRTWARKVLEKGMPAGVEMFNINIPVCPDDPHQYRITRLEDQNYYVFQRPGRRDFEKTYELRAKLQIMEEKLHTNSDIYTICIENMVSVTPLTWDMSVGISEY